MSKNGALFRIVPYGPAAVTSAGSVSGVNPDFPLSALANIQPKVVARSGTAGATRDLVIDIDLGADHPVSSVAVLHTNMTAGAQWHVLGRSSVQGPFATPGLEENPDRFFGQIGLTAVALPPTTRENRRFAFAVQPARVARYIRVFLREPVAAFLEVGTILVLERLAMGQGEYDNFELGSGRRVDDRSQQRELPGGETAIERGGRVPIWRATWSSLTEAHLRELWSLLMEVGTGAPILAAEFQDGSTGQAEALHYGVIQNIDFSERVQLDKQRIELRVRELL